MNSWLIFAVSFLIVGSAAKADDNDAAVPLEVTYCQLVGNPSAYVRKRIIVRAIYEYGFEVRVLKSPACCPEIEPKVGVAFEPEMDNHSQKLFRKLDKGMGTALVLFAGTFEKVSNSSSQLPSGERFQLSVNRIERVEKSVRWQGSDPVWAPNDCGATS
jgi:hypothetical protein